jgi:hypothetical protein
LKISAGCDLAATSLKIQTPQIEVGCGRYN